MKSLNQHLQEQFGTTFEIGISINTGETVIGNIGFEQKMDYTVIGDAVNTVFRIQDVCRSLPDTILAIEMTRRAARAQPRVQPLVGYARDESSESIRIFEVLGQ